MASNYDNSAAFYDPLSRMVFGDALVKAQTYFLPQIPAGSLVIIIGGGTGWILDEIAKVHPSGLKITYVEISAKMIKRSRDRNLAGNEVQFVNHPIEAVAGDKLFDVVITPFLFDNYKDEAMPGLFSHINLMLKPQGIWLNTDFQLTGKWWQFMLLNSMLLFFKICCGVESWRLPEAAKQFHAFNYLLMEKKHFFKDFVVTGMYRK